MSFAGYDNFTVVIFTIVLFQFLKFTLQKILLITAILACYFSPICAHDFGKVDISEKSVSEKRS